MFQKGRNKFYEPVSDNMRNFILTVLLLTLGPLLQPRVFYTVAFYRQVTDTHTHCNHCQHALTDFQ